VVVLWPVFSPDAGVWGQAAPSGTTGGGSSPETGTPSSTQGQPSSPAESQPPLFVPQYPTLYPPAFQGPQPYGTPAPVGPGAPGAGSPVWTPPVAPPPSQAHPPGGLPAGFLSSGGGAKFFQLNPTLSVSESWTDNFNLSASNKVTNYRSVLGPGANVLINGPTTKGFLTSNAGLTYDTAPSSSNYNLFPTITAGVTQILTPRLNLTLTDSYTRNNNPSQTDQFGLNTQRQTYSQNSFSASANYLIDRVNTQAYYNNSYFSSGGGNGTATTSNILGVNASTQVALYHTVSVGYAFSWSDTSGASSGNNSGQTTGNLFTAALSRQTGLYSSVGISGSYQLQSAPQSDQTIWNVSLFSTYGFPSGLSLSSSVGYSQISSDNAPTSSGVSSNSNLSYRFTRAVVTVGIFSDFRQTALSGQDFGIVQTSGYTGSLLYTFTPLVSGSLQASYYHNSPTGNGNNNSSPSQSTFTGGANLSYAMLRWLSLNGNYTYSLLSNRTTGSLTGSGTISINTATISLQAIF